MNYATRQALYRTIEKERETKVFTFITSDRKDMETIIAQDCIVPFVDLLEQVGPTKRISLILHTNGGQTLAAWRLVNLLRIFCDELEVLIPLNALSAGTLIAIGADKIIMTKQAALGPIDPSVNHPLNPQALIGGQSKQVPVSVESVRGYLDEFREGFKSNSEQQISSVLLNLSNHIHPLVLGEIFRTQSQIRFLAKKLLPRQINDDVKIKSIIDFLCADSGSHDYTINRREATELGLRIEKPSDRLYKLLRKIHLSYMEELELLEPYMPQTYLAKTKLNVPVPYCITRGLIESTIGGCYQLISEGHLTKVQMQTNNLVHEGVNDKRSFDGWRKLT